MIPRLKIGLSDFMPVYIKDKDRYLGAFIIGKPGSGKSNLLENFWWQDCLYKTAKICIDPSGFLAPKLHAIARGRAQYCSLDNPISINPLAAPFKPHQIIDDVIETVNQVVQLTTDNQLLTAKMRGLIREATMWCLKNNRPRLDAIRDRIDMLKGEAVTKDGITSRLDMLIADEALQKMFCGGSAIDWEKLIERGETFILDCHGMSKDRMIFVGTSLIHSLKSYFRYTRKNEYKPCIVYTDECHNFINPNWLDLLKESRKYNFSIILATQDFTNMGEKLTRTLLSNIGTLITFRAGYIEASKISQEFTNITTEQILTLAKHHVAYRTPESEGIAKISKALPVKQMDLPIEGNYESSALNIRPKWFPLEPFHNDKESATNS